jgi:hypothetical protein
MKISPYEHGINVVGGHGLTGSKDIVKDSVERK